MRDAVAEIIDVLLPWTGVGVWRGALPSGFQNSAPAVVVTMAGDVHAVSGATRLAMVHFRVYGGSARHADAATVYNELCSRLTAASSGGLMRVGDLNGQELPPDPDTGWPSYQLRATARLQER